MKITEIRNLYIYEKENGMGSEIKDKFHTMSELYFNRMILFSIICSLNKNRSWKSKFHSDGTMYDGFFIVGIDTKEGQFTYHYNLKYWNFFECKEVKRAPKYDDHKPEDIGRLFSLLDKEV